MERGVERLKGRFLPTAAVTALHLLKTQRPAPGPLTSLLANLAPTEESPRACIHGPLRHPALLHPHPTTLTETNSSPDSLLKPPSLQPASHLAAIWDLPRPPFSSFSPPPVPSSSSPDSAPHHLTMSSQIPPLPLAFDHLCPRFPTLAQANRPPPLAPHGLSDATGQTPSHVPWQHHSYLPSPQASLPTSHQSLPVPSPIIISLLCKLC